MMAEDPSAIRADIADTRERLSNTIGEIGERLNPQLIKANVKDSIREATIGRVSTMAQQAVDSVSRTTNGLGATIRENPIPVAMVAIGLGWMIWNARAQSTDERIPRSGTDIGYGPDYGPSYDSQYGQRFGASSFDPLDESLDAASTASTFADRARHTADSAKQRTQQVAGNVRDRAQHAAAAVKDRAQHAYGSAADATRRGAMRVEDTFQENPIAVGAVALAIGLAAGLAAPVSDREVRLMGDARDNLVDRVKDVADETRTKAEHVASRVAAEAKTAAREEGLTGSQPPRATI